MISEVHDIINDDEMLSTIIAHRGYPLTKRSTFTKRFLNKIVSLAILNGNTTYHDLCIDAGTTVGGQNLIKSNDTGSFFVGEIRTLEAAVSVMTTAGNLLIDTQFSYKDSAGVLSYRQTWRANEYVDAAATYGLSRPAPLVLGNMVSVAPQSNFSGFLNLILQGWVITLR